MKDRYFFGFTWWKRWWAIKPFFPNSRRNHFCTTLRDAKQKGLSRDDEIYIWGRRLFEEVEAYAKRYQTPLFRVEDGFIRSVSLGSDLTKAYSLVVDSRGIYFDPTQESDLEYMLNTKEFDSNILQRASKLSQYLIENKLSKYNANPDKEIQLEGVKQGERIVMVPGQVEDDASIIYGADSMTNLELLKKARHNAPDAYIIYKPHPDVLAGNRKGSIALKDVLKYANTIITDVSLDSVLEHCDEVHTMTSLVGFEALIRGKVVYTYGMPFYAGWGLTHDERKCKRRFRKRTLNELIAATLIDYPRYINPFTNEPCEVEEAISNIELMKKRYNTDKLYKFGIDLRNSISRKAQFMIKVLFSE